jgi:dihydrofolate synthase/folylpolyglutamate synthase
MFGARRFGVKLGLERMTATLAALGHPERRMGWVIQVGGTNGKGSTCGFLESALGAAGRRVGLYTSPHLSRFSERYRIAGVEIDGERLAAAYAAHAELLEPLTFFERATVLATLVFAEAGLDVTILEVGLGGRFDATTAIDPDVAVVTGVAMDHTEILGSTIAAIAGEKAGIWKAGRHAVVGSAGAAEARPILIERARAVGVAEVTVSALAPPPSYALGLRGGHQALNAACALATLDALERQSGHAIAVDEAARKRGLATATWPGRLEQVCERPRIWLDAAHNPDGAQALAAALRAERPGRLVAVCGVSADKDVAGVLAPVVSFADVVVATQGPPPRALEAAAVATMVEQLPRPPSQRLIVVPDPHEALARARGQVQRVHDLVIVFGSIFLVGEVRAKLRGEAVDGVAAQDPPVSPPASRPGAPPGSGTSKLPGGA